MIPSISKTPLVEQVNACLRSGEYSRALDLLRSAAAEFPNDAELSELQKRARDGVERSAEANRLITESQELFAHQKSAEAIQLLRKAYELDKHNSLARAILANSLVEHAHSLVETDWLEAETLTNQALALNPAHPTAKTIHSLVVEQKKTSSVDDWVTQARKRQSSGDLFAALAWVAEGLAVHPDDPKLLQIHDDIQRDQGARRRQVRRGDLDDLRRMELEIDSADASTKQALAERIQAVAAKHWTDGEILSVANGLLQRLGLVPQDGSTASQKRKSTAVIFHVPRPNAPEASRANRPQTPSSPVLPSQILPSEALSGSAPADAAPPSAVATSSPEPKLPAPPTLAISAPDPAKSAAILPSESSQPQQGMRSRSALRIVAFAAAIVLVAAIFFLAGRHSSPPVAKAPAAAPIVAPTVVPAPVVSAPAVSEPAVSAPVAISNEPTTPEVSSPVPQASSEAAARKITPTTHSSVELSDGSRNLGSLVVIAGQDDAKVFLSGKLQPQLTHAGQLRLPNLALKDYVVQVSKTGFQDPPQQQIHIRGGEQAKLVFNLQPQPRAASLTIQGGAPGTTVLIDQNPVGTIQSDGTFSVSTVNPGDHTVELRKDRFKSRQFTKHFVVGGAISLAAADTALESAPAALTITFTPADAKVAIVKGELLAIVNSGVPLNLAPGTYTLTARTTDRFTRTSTLEVIAGQSKSLNLPLAPNGMSKWDDPAAWKHEGDSFIRKGGDFVLYGDVPSAGTFVFSAMPAKGHPLQWVLNYIDPKNYILFQMDDSNFSRTVIRNGEKTSEIKVPDKSDKKSFRTLSIRVSPTEVTHQIKHGDSWIVLDRWTQPGMNLSLGKFGFNLPGNDQVTLSSFAHYADLNIR